MVVVVLSSLVEPDDPHAMSIHVIIAMRLCSMNVRDIISPFEVAAFNSRYSYVAMVNAREGPSGKKIDY